MTTRPELSVVIPVRDGAHLIERQLRALSQQTFRDWELVISDNGSTDSLRAVVERWAPLLPAVCIVDSGQKPGINHARNAGVLAARADLIVLCDCDDEVNARWLEAYQQCFEAGASTVGGRLDVVSELGGPVGFESGQESLFGGFGFLLYPAGANCGFTRAAWLSVGGFDESFRGGGDETDFFWRTQLHGYPLVYAPHAVVSYVQRPTLRGLAQQSYAYGRSHVRLYGKFSGAGMPPRYGLLSSVRLAKASLNAALKVGTRGTVPTLLSRVAIFAGRIRESFSSRRLYL